MGLVSGSDSVFLKSPLVRLDWANNGLFARFLRIFMTRVMWRAAKKKKQSWAHVEVSLSGERDLCRCNLCNLEFGLEVGGRSRESVLLEIARKHFYKHGLDRALAIGND